MLLILLLLITVALAKRLPEQMLSIGPHLHLFSVESKGV